MTENQNHAMSPGDPNDPNDIGGPEGEQKKQEGQHPSEKRAGVRGTAAMDQETRKEVARKGGLAVSRNRQHMAEIGRKGGQAVSKNREHMARIGRKGGAASRGSTKPGSGSPGDEGQGI